MTIQTQIIKLHPDNPDRATLHAIARRIFRGELIVLPTDTIYGFHCRADDEAVLLRLQALKGRGQPKPLVTIIPSAEFLWHQGLDIPPAAARLMERFWPGPLTLVLPVPPVFPAALTAGAPSLAVRVPGYPVLNRISRICGLPLASTSVNATGAEPLQDVKEIIAAFEGRVHCIVDAGRLPDNKPSTIVSFAQEPAAILREGAIPAEFIRPLL